MRDERAIKPLLDVLLRRTRARTLHWVRIDGDGHVFTAKAPSGSVLLEGDRGGMLGAVQLSVKDDAGHTVDRAVAGLGATAARFAGTPSGGGLLREMFSTVQAQTYSDRSLVERLTSEFEEGRPPLRALMKGGPAHGRTIEVDEPPPRRDIWYEYPDLVEIPEGSAYPPDAQPDQHRYDLSAYEPDPTQLEPRASYTYGGPLPSA
jgi:hypothetical protein